MDLKLNILDFDDSISQAFLQTDIDLEGKKDFYFNHLFHHLLWSEGKVTNATPAAHTVVFTSCMSVDFKKLHRQEELNIASCTQPYSILTGPPLYPSLEYVTTICSSCHHCTNH